MEAEIEALLSDDFENAAAPRAAAMPSTLAWLESALEKDADADADADVEPSPAPHSRASSGSPYSPWAASLPATAPDAASWPAAARALLAGTDLGLALVLVEEELRVRHSR